MTIRLRHAASLLALAAVVGMTACETAPPPAPPPPPAYVPPPPPPLPNLALSQAIIDQAAVYQGYMQRASAIQTPFPNAESIQSGLRSAQAFNAQQLQRGAVAYGAVVALQDPTFVSAVRELGRDPAQRAALVQRLLSEPGYAVAFNGSASAAGLVVSALNQQGATLLATGNRVKQQAYDIQRQRWAMADIPRRPERLQAARDAAAPLTADVAQAGVLRSAAYGEAPMAMTAASAGPPYTPTVARALAIAAIAALGEADGVNAPAVEALLTEPSSGACLNLTRLMLYQCLSVAKPWYEDVFCLGQHVLIDTANCVNRAAGAATPIIAPTTPAVTTANVTPVPQASVNAAAAGASPAQAAAAANAPTPTAPAGATPPR